MTPIDPPSEGQAPRAASAGLVQPPPGLLYKVADAIHCRWLRVRASALREGRTP